MNATKKQHKPLWTLEELEELHSDATAMEVAFLQICKSEDLKRDFAITTNTSIADFTDFGANRKPMSLWKKLRIFLSFANEKRKNGLNMPSISLETGHKNPVITFEALDKLQSDFDAMGESFLRLCKSKDRRDDMSEVTGSNRAIFTDLAGARKDISIAKKLNIYLDYERNRDVDKEFI